MLPAGGQEPHAVPLRAVHLLDQTYERRSGIRLQYSLHAGADALKPHVLRYFGEEDASMGWTAEGLSGHLVSEGCTPWDGAGMTFCIATNPAPDDAGLKQSDFEAVLNTTKFPRESKLLMALGIVSPTGRTLTQGYYVNHPVCRVNVPLRVQNI